MIIKPDINDLLEKSKNRYELVNVISKRARQINGGDQPMVDTNEKSEVTIAAEEFDADKFKIVDENAENIEDIETEETAETENTESDVEEISEENATVEGENIEKKTEE